MKVVSALQQLASPFDSISFKCKNDSLFSLPFAHLSLLASVGWLVLSFLVCLFVPPWWQLLLLWTPPSPTSLPLLPSPPSPLSSWRGGGWGVGCQTNFCQTNFFKKWSEMARKLVTSRLNLADLSRPFQNNLFLLFLLSRSRAKRVGPKGLRAESARAVTGRRSPHSGEGEDFLTGQIIFFTETAVTPERKVEKSFPMSEINRHAEG